MRVWHSVSAGSGAGIDVLAVQIIRSLNPARKGIPVSARPVGKAVVVESIALNRPPIFMDVLWVHYG